MAATVNDFNLSYIGQGPSGSGQIIAEQTSGPKAKTLYGYGVLKAASTLGTTITSSNVGWVDGVQSLGNTIVTTLQSVAAPVTLNGVANQAFYAGNKGATAFIVGDSATIAGFATSANNVTATVNVVTSTGFYVTNASSVAETNPAATAVVTRGGIPAVVSVSISPAPTDTNGLVTGRAAFVGTILPSAITATGCVLNYGALGTTSNSVTIGFVLEFAS